MYFGLFKRATRSFLHSLSDYERKAREPTLLSIQTKDSTRDALVLEPLSHSRYRPHSKLPFKSILMHTILVAFVTTYPKVQQTYGIGEGSSPSLRPKAHIDRDDKCREQKCFNEMECLCQHPPRAAMMRLLSPFRRRKHSLPRRPTIVSIQAVIRGGRRKKACSHPRTCIGSKPYKGGQWYKQAYHDFIETSPLIALESSSAIDSTVHSWF